MLALRLQYEEEATGEIYARRARSIPTPRDSRNKKFNVSFIA